MLIPKRRTTLLVAVSLFGVLVCVQSPQAQQVVKVTALGSHPGEMCVDDRALLFEDPTGVRILYDPGFTTDESDPRLGDVHLVLLSHAHVDHIGGNRPSRGGTCAAPGRGVANPYRMSRQSPPPETPRCSSRRSRRLSWR